MCPLLRVLAGKAGPSIVTKVEGGQLDVAFTDRGKAARTYPLADWCVAVVPAGY